MKRFYSPTTGCTYLESIHTEIPDDAVYITEERFTTVIANPALGKVRDHDNQGLPVLRDPLPATGTDLAEEERRWRDSELISVAWLRDRHRDQLDVGVKPTLSAEQFTELLSYMQILRDWPTAQGFPAREHRPQPLAWVAEQLQQK